MKKIVNWRKQPRGSIPLSQTPPHHRAPPSEPMDVVFGGPRDKPKHTRMTYAQIKAHTRHEKGDDQ